MQVFIITLPCKRQWIIITRNSITEFQCLHYTRLVKLIHQAFAAYYHWIAILCILIHHSLQCFFSTIQQTTLTWYNMWGGLGIFLCYAWLKGSWLVMWTRSPQHSLNSLGFWSNFQCISELLCFYGNGGLMSMLLQVLFNTLQSLGVNMGGRLSFSDCALSLAYLIHYNVEKSGLRDV